MTRLLWLGVLGVELYKVGADLPGTLPTTYPHFSPSTSWTIQQQGIVTVVSKSQGWFLEAGAAPGWRVAWTQVRADMKTAGTPTLGGKPPYNEKAGVAPGRKVPKSGKKTYIKI